jgi:hypothetical protein
MPVIRYFWYDEIKTCLMHGENEKCVKNCSWKIRRDDAAWETLA